MLPVAQRLRTAGDQLTRNRERALQDGVVILAEIADFKQVDHLIA